ncbi:MAG: heparinase II/III family protein [Planctomycetota bacterium]
MEHPATFLIVFAILLAGAVVAQENTDDAWIAKIRKDHPRLFFNKDTWPKVKWRALGPAKDCYDRIKSRVDKCPDDPQAPEVAPVSDQPVTIGGKVYQMTQWAPIKEWGPEAAQTAFVYLMTGERKYLEKAKKMLKVSVATYHKCYECRRAVAWYSTSRICALAAYDWLYNDLTPEERKEIGGGLLKHIDDVQPGKDKPKIFRLNGSDHTTGFYGVRNLVWFAGLAAHNDGINDDLALNFLKLGYKYNQDLFNYRKMCAGDDGGLASGTVGYSMGAYPWSQCNFLHTWLSATGENVAPEWPHLAYFPNWIIWNWIPAEDKAKEFGWGDTTHYTNDLGTYRVYEHMAQVMHFYGKSHPDCAAVAATLCKITPVKSISSGEWPMLPFILTGMDDAPPPCDPATWKLHARHFETLGQIFMRSGFGPDDTYCLYTIGGTVAQHKHFDENNFVIYKKGFLALDTGTRGNENDFQLRHYYAQTVAHNCVLIHMPGEPLAPYWGKEYKDGPEGKLAHGGMNKQVGATVAAFETNDHYTYIAGDATRCYAQEKCVLALRQFVFVMPDYFVICDRVVSTKPEYRKEWLLHTQNEPAIDGSQFRADEGKGRLFCRTLLPKDAKLTKVGEPGKEFWASGMNWEINDAVKEQLRKAKEKTGQDALLGNWRMEISPASPRTDDVFLHLIQVGEQSLPRMCPSKLIEEPGKVGVAFEIPAGSVSVTFTTEGGPAGRIKMVSDGKVVFDRDLTAGVQPQTGLGVGK